jgi:pSer/pThr/pTyr-binding forkhead associated (FHA) protein
MKSIIKIGRDNSNDIAINEPRISRNHAIITDLKDGTYEIKDLGSTNGTFVNGERITQIIIIPGDKVEVATCLVNWVAAFTEPETSGQFTTIKEEPFSKIRKTISIGSSTENDLVLTESFVSNYHAKISLLKNGEYYIQDLSSSNGTFVNGIRIESKNFTKTDAVKIASANLPQDWFLHKKLRRRFFKDHKKAWLISLSLLMFISASVLIYFNQCKWFDCGCNLSAQQIYLTNKNSLVHIVHDYYYKIDFRGKTYYVGKNNLFKLTEANTSKENLLPYSSVSGSGCFISNDGTILTSACLVSPWLNEPEKEKMIQEVIASKTIKYFSPGQDYQVCGETADLQWLAEGLVNNAQNYIAATAATSCQLTDSSSVTIRSVKNILPKDANTVSFSIDPMGRLNKTPSYYYSVAKLLTPNSSSQDTFYFARDSSDINRLDSMPVSQQLPELQEGGVVLNERGELVGNIQQHQVILIHRFYKQIKTQIHANL